MASRHARRRRQSDRAARRESAAVSPAPPQEEPATPQTAAEESGPLRGGGRPSAPSTPSVLAQSRPRTGPKPDLAVVAVAFAGGVLFYDLARGASASGKPLDDQHKLSAALSYGIGAIILLALADTVPEIGVPLSVLLLLTVAVGRPQAIDFVSRLAGGQAPQGKAAPVAAVVVGHTKTGAPIMRSPTGATWVNVGNADQPLPPSK